MNITTERMHGMLIGAGFTTRKRRDDLIECAYDTASKTLDSPVKALEKMIKVIKDYEKKEKKKYLERNYHLCLTARDR